MECGTDAGQIIVAEMSLPCFFVGKTVIWG